MIFSIAILGQQAWADNLSFDTLSTENGYNRFCQTDAKSAINQLNALSDLKLEKVKGLSKDYDSLQARKAILEGLLTIKDEYLKAAKEIASDQELKKSDDIRKINSFKTLLRSSLTLSAVKLMIKPSNEKIEDIVDLCNKIPENTNSKFCSSVKHLAPAFFSTEKRNLNEVVKNLNLAMTKIDDTSKNKLREDANKILDSFQDGTHPENMLEILMNSKTFTEVLAGGDKDNIQNCLNDDELSCKRLIENREGLSKILTTEMLDIHKELATSKLKAFFENYDQVAPTQDQLVSSILSEKIQAAQDQFPSNDQDSTKSDFSFVKSPEIEDFKSNCIKKDSQQINLQNCKKLAESISAKIEDELKNIKTLTENATKTLDEAKNQNGSVEALEIFKQYLANKYMRSCPHPDVKNVRSSINNLSTSIDSEEPQCQQTKEQFSLQNFKNSFSSIVKKLITYSNLSLEKNELGTFSKEELRTYINYCNNSTLPTENNVVSLICADAKREYKAIEKKKDSKEWDEFNRKYWVQYNAKSESGFEVLEKKSNWRILGEGLSYSIPQLFPAAMQNFQMGFQIDQMTQQALFQKQFSYMNDPNSPWMVNYPYFQSNYLTNVQSISSTGFDFNQK